MNSKSYKLIFQQYFEEYLLETTQRFSERAKLRKDNYEAAENREELNTVKLDSGLKRVTAVIKKIKVFSESSSSGIIKEIVSVNLSRHIEEVRY